MATRRKRSSKKPPERWNAPARRRNPAGLLVVLAGLSGLVYFACAPKTSTPVSPGEKTDVAQSNSEKRPPTPDRATPPKPKVDVTETTPKRERDGATPPPNSVEGPAGTPDAPKPSKEIIEPTVSLGGDSPAPEKRAARPPRAASREFIGRPGADGEVALTFDGCFDDKPLPKILAALDHHGYKATFFIAGRFAQRYPRSVKRISDEGMEIGNHSWSHPKFTGLTDEQIDGQLSRTNDLIHQITGQTPSLFRPPFGDRDARVGKEVAADGFQTVYWALDSWDSVKKGITSEEVSSRVLARVRPGDVVLLHVGSEATAEALPTILEGLDAKGLRVVPVSELMKG